MKLKGLEDGTILNEGEKCFLSQLIRTAKALGNNIQVFIVGGWVRDHLLGIESNDLDILIDGTTPDSFGDMLRLLFPEEITFMKHSKISPTRIQNFPITKAILKSGFEIDLLNCHPVDEEKYKNNRVVGDVMRRDLTINSLLYNVLTGKIEDHVGGLYDLEHRIARTTLPPDVVFQNDQIQVIRCVRFSARLNLTLAEGVFEAISHASSNTHGNLTVDITQREVIKALSSENTQRYFKLLIQSHFFKIVFGDYNWNLLEVEKCVNEVCEKTDISQRPCLILAALIRTLEKTNHELTTRKKKALSFGTNASFVAKASSEISDILSNFNIVNIAKWLKKNMNFWRDSITLYEITYEHCKTEFQTVYTSQDIKELIIKENLETIVQKKLLNGYEIQKLFRKENGNLIKECIDLMFEWSVYHPSGTKDEFIEYAHQMITENKF